MAWDFWSYSPEALHQITILFSDRGTPNGYRHMNGYSSHTFKWVNEAGEAFLVKYHFKTDSGIKTFTNAESVAKGVENKDWSTWDLYNHIGQGNSSSWTWYVQVMPFADAEKYRFDVYDITKVWPHSDYPLQQVGKLVLNRNPENYHAETEQSAFAPSHLVPGIEPSLDKMLQGRLFSYPDTHRHRLGPNYEQLPINCPYRAKSHNYHRDGFPMTYSHYDTQGVNYEPNSLNGPHENKAYAQHKWTVSGEAGRYAHQHPNDNYEQPRALFRKVFNDQERKTVIENIGAGLKDCRIDIKERMIQHFYKVDPEYGEGIAKIIGVSVNKSKL